MKGFIALFFPTRFLLLSLLFLVQSLLFFSCTACSNPPHTPHWSAITPSHDLTTSGPSGSLAGPKGNYLVKCFNEGVAVCNGLQVLDRGHNNLTKPSSLYSSCQECSFRSHLRFGSVSRLFQTIHILPKYQTEPIFKMLWERIKQRLFNNFQHAACQFNDKDRIVKCIVTSKQFRIHIDCIAENYNFVSSAPTPVYWVVSSVCYSQTIAPSEFASVSKTVFTRIWSQLPDWPRCPVCVRQEAERRGGQGDSCVWS